MSPQDMEVTAEELERVLNAVLQKSKCHTLVPTAGCDHTACALQPTPCFPGLPAGGLQRQLSLLSPGFRNDTS